MNHEASQTDDDPTQREEDPPQGEEAEKAKHISLEQENNALQTASLDEKEVYEDGTSQADENDSTKQDQADKAPGKSLEQEIRDLERDSPAKIKAKLEADEALAKKSIRLRILKGLRKDLTTTLPAYEDAFDQLYRKKEDIRDFLGDENDKLIERLGVKKAKKVEDLEKQQIHRTEELEDKVEEAQEALFSAEKNRNKKKAKLEKRSAVFNEWKNITATVKSRQAVMQKFIDEVKKESDEGRYAVSYWVLRSAQAKHRVYANDRRLVDPPDVSDRFREAGGRLADAEAELARAESAVELAKKVLDGAKQERDQHQSTSEATLRAELEKITTQEP